LAASAGAPGPRRWPRAPRSPFTSASSIRPRAPRRHYQVGYQCWRNVYDCRDFRTQAEAQAVYGACGGPKKDVHHLDWDGNGRACDHLP
jgi:Excalibur calcium-binding domain